MTKPWWAGAMKHSLASLLGCARSRERYPDLGFEDRAAEALVGRVGLRRELFGDDELRPLVLVAMTLDVVIEHRLSVRREVGVVHLGGGLSTRPQRLKTLASRWLDVDEPGQAEMKRELFGGWVGYAQVGCEPGDTSWVDRVASWEQPLLLVSESGLLESCPGDFHAVLDAVSHRLPAGTELLFAHDWRHLVEPFGAERSLLVRRTGGQGASLQIRYPRLRFVPQERHDPDVWAAMQGVESLHLVYGKRLPAIAHVALV